MGLSKPVLVSASYYLDLHYPADIHYGFDPEAPQSQWIKQEDALQDDPRLRHVADGIEWTKQWRAESTNFTGDVKVMGGEACLWAELVDPDVGDPALEPFAGGGRAPLVTCEPNRRREHVQTSAGLLVEFARRSRVNGAVEAARDGF